MGQVPFNAEHVMFHSYIDVRGIGALMPIL